MKENTMTIGESLERLAAIADVGDKLTSDQDDLLTAAAELTNLHVDALDEVTAAVAATGTKALLNRLLGEEIVPASESVVRATFMSAFIMGWLGARLADGDKIGETL